MKLYAVNTQEKCDALLRELELKGCKWADGKLATEYNPWTNLEESTVIEIHDDNELDCGSRKYYAWASLDSKIIDYEIKKFKVGDRVRHSVYGWEAIVKHVYDNGSFGINDAPFFYYPESCELVEAPQKPTVPKCFDDYVRDLPKDYEPSLAYKELVELYDRYTMNDNLAQWFHNDKNKWVIALQALQNGYEVEKEPLYYVKIGELYLKEPLADTSIDTVQMTQRTLSAYKFRSEKMAELHAERFGGITVRVEEDE